MVHDFPPQGRSVKHMGTTGTPSPARHHRHRDAPWWYLILEHLWLFVRDWVAWWFLPSRSARAPTLHPVDSLLLLSATDLAAQIRTGKLTSREVTAAYIARAKAVNPYVNAIVVDRYEEAMQEAQRADDLIATKSPLVAKMPFLGVPCTIKEAFCLEGMPNTSGQPTRLPEHALSKIDAVAVARMRAAGLIPIGVTNTSELCMWYESNNKVYGRTCNPYDLRRIVGGSSGGEGAAVGAAMSVLGLGADIGGSIRMPAFFNGVFGHKPSPAVVPNDGQHPLAQNESQRYCVTGPICRYATDLWPMMQILKDPEIDLGDPTTVNLKKLRVLSIGGYPGMLLCQSITPEMEEAQTRVLNHLVHDLGMEQIVPPPELLEGFTHSFDIWSSMLNAAADPCFAELLVGRKQVDFIRDFGEWFAGRSPHTLPALVLGLIEKWPERLVPSKVRKDIARGLVLRQQIQSILGDDGILLYPVHPTPAIVHNAPCLVPFNFQYTGIINVLELPSTAVPMGLSKSLGVPLGVQIAANELQDKLCVAVAIELERRFGGWVRPTGV